MSWQERIGPASYTSPSGVKIPFLYENVSKQVDKHTTAFEFPDADGTFVQSLGRSGRRLPLRLMFSGEDYDIEANAFDEMLNEDGIGILEHPMYGTINVVPFGQIIRRDNLKTGGNQAIFEVTFFETNDLLFPLQVDSAAQDLQSAIDLYLASAPEEFEETIDQDLTEEKISLKDRYKSVKDAAKSGLQKVADVQEDIQQVFDTVNDAIDDAIEVFIADPLALAFQTGIMLQAPARSAALITDRLTAYGDLLVGIFTNNVGTPSTDSQASNQFRSDDLLASNLLMATATAVLNNEFETKTDALAAADVLLASLDEFTTWRDDNLVALGLIDAGNVYQKIIDGMSTAAGFLVQISFSLKQERSIVLTTAATPLELEARFYGTLDTNLDFLINSNAFVGDELFEVPIGRRVVYYA